MSGLTVVEQPVVFAGKSVDLRGVLDVPSNDAASRSGVVFASGGGYGLVAGRNRHWARLARVLGEAGWASLRFAYPGVADSDGRNDIFDLAVPFDRDLAAAIDRLRDAGVNNVAAVGWCFGARAVSAQPPGSLEHLILLSPPFRDSYIGAPGVEGKSPSRDEFLPSPSFSLQHLQAAAADPRGVVRWLGRLVRRRRSGRNASDQLGMASTRFIDELEAHLASGARLLIVYGEEDRDLGDFRDDCQDRLGAVLASYRAQVQVEVVDGPVHDLATLSSQQSVIDLCASFLTSEEPIDDRLRRVLRTQLGVDGSVPLDDAADLQADLGLDSAGLLELVLVVEREFEIDVPDTDITIDNFGSVGHLADYVAKRL